MNEDQSGGDRVSSGATRRHGRTRITRKASSKALQRALQQARDAGAIDVGRHYESEVRFFVDIEVTNPPWVGDYRVQIDPRERP